MEKTKNAGFEEIRRNVAGIDIAWRADHYVCGPRREDGECEIVSFGTTTFELYRMVSWLKERQVESVAMESTSVYWIPAADLLESNGIEVVLVDPREVRMVPGRKSDIKDCQWLQKLHSCGLLRGAFRPPEAIAAVRSILRERDTLQAMRTQAIQQMQKSLDQMNIRVHHAVSDIDGKTGTSIIQAIVEGERNPLKLAELRDRRCKKSVIEIAAHLTGTWREEHLFNLGQAFKTLRFLDERLAEYDVKVQAMLTSLAEAAGSCDNREQSPPSPPPPLSGKAEYDEKAEAVSASLAGAAGSSDNSEQSPPSPPPPLSGKAEHDEKAEAVSASLAGAAGSSDNSEQSPPSPPLSGKAECDVKRSAIASLAEAAISSDNREQSPPPPPPLPIKKLTAKQQADEAKIDIIQRLMGFDMPGIPGIGYRTATIIITELGTTFDRFPDEKHFASYIGLAPALGKSAGKNISLKKGCQNTSRAGQALRMAASTLYRSETELGAYLRNVARQTDKKTAIKATARRLAHMIFRGVKYGKEYIDSGAEAYEARLRARTVKTVNRLIKSYNINSSEISALTAS